MCCVRVCNGWFANIFVWQPRPPSEFIGVFCVWGRLIALVSLSLTGCDCARFDSYWNTKFSIYQQQAVYEEKQFLNWEMRKIAKTSSTNDRRNKESGHTTNFCGGECFVENIFSEGRVLANEKKGNMFSRAISLFVLVLSWCNLFSLLHSSVRFHTWVLRFLFFSLLLLSLTYLSHS